MREHNSKLRLLLLSEDKYPPFRSDVKILFGKEIAGRGHHIDWILQSDDDCERSYKTTWYGCRVWVGKTNNGTSRVARLKKHIYSIQSDLRMFSLLRKGRYDFIQVKDKFISALFAIIAARRFKTKFIYWLSYPHPEDYLYKVKTGTARYPIFYYFGGLALKVLLYRIILPSAEHIFVQSEQMKKDVADHGIKTRKMTAIPMGVSLESFPHEQNKQFPEMLKGKHNLVYIGTLVKVRRIDFLVRVLERVRRKSPETVLYLVGDGDDPSDRDVIIKESSRLGIDPFVIITGFLSQDQALAYVAKADVCISPFYPTPILNSTSPTKLIEYMAMARPVVANDHPEQRLVINESQGGYCVPYDEQAFAEAIISILEDPNAAAEMGQRGRRYVEQKRDYKSIADKVEADYLRLCGAG